MATKNIPPELRLCELYGASFATGVLPRRVWNGIFAAGDWRAKRGPEDDVSAQRPEIRDHHTLRVPPNRIIDRIDNPTNRAVVCFTPEAGILCFVRPSES